MKFRIKVLITLLIILAACNKDKFQTKPQIKIKNLSTTEVLPGGQLNITCEYTDKEGDLGDGEFTYIRVRTNRTPIPNPSANDKLDTVRTPIPSFPKNDNGELLLNITYNFMDEDPNRNDTMFFKIVAKDIKNNSSDTVLTQPVVARQN